MDLDGLKLTSKLIEGRFPDYERVIPEGSDKTVHGDRGRVRAALSRAAILSNEKFRGVRLTLSGSTLRIQTQNPEQEEAEEEVEVQYSGSPLEIGFNVGYLLDALDAIEGNEVHHGAAQRRRQRPGLRRGQQRQQVRCDADAALRADRHFKHN